MDAKEELIKLYIDFSDYLGKYNGASERDFQNHHKNFNIPTKEYFTKKFGTFGKLRIASGFSEFIEANRLGYRKYSRDQIIHLLYKKHKKYNINLSFLIFYQNFLSYLTLILPVNPTCHWLYVTSVLPNLGVML